MQNVGLGIDLIEIERFRKICERTPSFTSKMFSAQEIKYCESKSDPVPHFAARFAAKEAALKALGCGFSAGVGYRDLEVKIDDKGAPRLNLYNKAAEIAEELNVNDIAISISHTANDAICCAIALQKEERDSKTTVDELTRQFKELRLTI